MIYAGTSPWRTWRVMDGEDAATLPAASDYTPAKLGVGGYASGIEAKVIAGVPATTIGLRAWGQGGDNFTGQIQIAGYMDKSDPGPGQILWGGTLTAGAVTATYVPITDDALHGGTSRWGAAAAWFEIDTWNPTVSNACQAQVLSGSAQAMLVLPTLGYNTLLLESAFLKTEATEIDVLGIAWRPLDYEGVSVLL